ncbi:hypothetical protein [Catellatospora tritici]|uniref:hypothetical protein n=1 Tax=Catellatospora tritici TaxID=2851566 RepID=UPI001C2D2DBC|nr:hypothetical protein [Catellatospora tritici]MBV1850073.1 hypothetical protein [Catellatospora tritici]
MTDPESIDLSVVAAECVKLVAENHGYTLDYSLASLTVLDQVCAELLADGPLPEQRLNLWYQLAGAYTGEVCVRAYDGEWIEHEDSLAISVSGLKGFPFSTAYRVLTGEELKSLASFGRSIPAILERIRDR